jgi:hypothetical protein
MRGIGNHTPPVDMQPCPADNTSEHVMAQVKAWASATRTFPLIHTEAAREIAAWYQQSVNGFAQFASTGTIIDDLGDEIWGEYCVAIRESGEHSDEAISLAALHAYVLNAS